MAKPFKNLNLEERYRQSSLNKNPIASTGGDQGSRADLAKTTSALNSAINSAKNASTPATGATPPSGGGGGGVVGGLGRGRGGG